MNLACLQPHLIKCNVCGCEVTKIGSVAARAIGWWYLADLDAWRCPQHMTWQELRLRLLAICDQLDAAHPAGDPGMRNAIEALPDRSLLDRLAPELRAPIDTWLARLHPSWIAS